MLVERKIDSNFSLDTSAGLKPAKWTGRVEWYTWATTLIFIALGLFVTANSIVAQTTETVPSSSNLKKLSIDQLMDIEVTSVSGRPEKLSETASAIQVIAQEDIQRSGATSLPEALRLASNLQVAQIDSRQWAISARGFNNATSNKMLVLIDGRTVYTPLYAGVFWDVQDTLLEDVDRIEVISGPGATLWGANAVNGVINVTSKRAEDTQGFLVEAGVGSQLRHFINARYGGALRSKAHYRAYGKFFDRDSTLFSNSRDAGNSWHASQAGFRFDWQPSRANLVSLQGDGYGGRINQLNVGDTTVSGGNVIARWSHTISDKSDFRLQFYYDRTHRRIPNTFAERLGTYDLDFQHRLPIGKRNDVIWGLGFRQMNDNVENSPSFAFLPSRVNRRSFSGFVQNEIALVNERLSLTVGTKIEHNHYTGFEVEPGARLLWRVNAKQILWSAISRAVRTPSRIDTEVFIPAKAPFLLAGGPDFKSEDLLAFETGYRLHPHEQLSLSLATYYNDYQNLRSLEQVNPPRPLPIVIANKLKGESFGAELSVDYRPGNRLQLRAGYTEMRIHIRAEAASTDRSLGNGESHDPSRQFFLRPTLAITRQLELNSTFRAVSRIVNQKVPAYVELDLRLAWQPEHSLEISIVGQNLLHQKHPEFGAPTTRQEIERSVYGKVLWHFLKH